ncbi:hypothetical protein PHSY_004769 [Pseudozyma hubeiensis SY62]|uniref:Uncharacterized protein n=1 Tax=Pseudozyma hubeiensis (strain SY62) TaxID=1305764 RepID=R9P766_PSEHS|nr:hypothetical protein PHSY_004769 [Pseudozyma hubeiensis SY62]GAC97184.1 hypothetical protein PHSY_004769 [Pseudozyma hubeiensis SY62]
MRRRAPPPPSEVVDLDYGSAETPLASESQPGPSNEVEALAAPPQYVAVGRGRKLLSYETDDFDTAAPSTTAPVATNYDSAASQGLEYVSSASDVQPSAAAGPSSASHRRSASPASLKESLGGAAADHWERVIADSEEGGLPRPPPLPAYPPPALPQDVNQHGSAPYAYDPNAPEFHPILHASAPPTLPPESETYYAPPDQQAYHATAESIYMHPAGHGPPFPSYEMPYNPHAPYDPALHADPSSSYPYFPNPPNLTFYSQQHHPYPTGFNPQMQYLNQKRLLKQQRKREKKQRKRDKKEAANAAFASLVASYEPASSWGASGRRPDGDLIWTDDGKTQAAAMVRELHVRGVAPQRLVERGISMHMIEACCVEAGIPLRPLPAQDAEDLEARTRTMTEASSSQNGKVSTTPAEDELLAKEEQGIALTPLEELRKKVLASRLAKAATAASASANATPKVVDNTAAPGASSDTTTAFNRTATSGEADALLSQIGEVLRSLIRSASEAAAAAEDTSMQPTSSTTRKRSYRDVDAVEGEHGSITADLAGGDSMGDVAPSRRQRISYADTFSRRAEMPAGEVDLDAPVPDLPDLSVLTSNSPSLGDAAPRRRRPVAADFDTAEYRPQSVRQDRFLDVPSGLNTVVDLSDDESDEDEITAAGDAKGWTSVQGHVDMRDIVLLRQKTATEHYDTFCALNGIKPAAKPLARVQEGSVVTNEASEPSTIGEGVSKQSLLAHVAGTDAASVGTSTPSREDLLRKELEIKQLMQKIQMMEKRKSQQQSATPSPAVSPMPSRILRPVVSTQAPVAEGSQVKLPLGFGQSLGAAVDDAKSNAMAAPGLGVGTLSQTVSSSPAKTGGLRLDPALQKQRESLLALLANKRKNATADAAKAVTERSGSTNEGETSELPEVSSEQAMSSIAASNGVSAEKANVTQAVQPEVSREPPMPLHVEVEIIDAFSPLQSTYRLRPTRRRSRASFRAIDRWCRVYCKA